MTTATTPHPQPTPSTVHQHLSSPAQSWHGTISPSGPFTPTPNRYHLYIGLFCPFAHRVNLIRHLYNLQHVLPISVVRPYPKGDANGWPGWRFPKTDDEYPGATADDVFGSEYLHEVYFRADKGYKGRYSVPVLWDRETGGIVSNESAEMMRWLPGAWEGVVDGGNGERLDLYPEGLRGAIDEVGEWMQRDLNSGVYRAGFAETQEGYEKGVVPVFAALNRMERMLKENGGPWLLGARLTEVDVRAFVTVVRFDVVYVQHFKCNFGTIRHDYPQINNWLKRLYWSVKGFKETTDFKHIKENYTKSHFDINPKAITPMGPFPDIEEGWVEYVTKVKVGGVMMREVVESEQKLSGGFVKDIDR